MFVVCDGTAWLVVGRELLRWTPGGYTERTARPSTGAARVITPPSLLAVLRAGWEPEVPLLHPSAGEKGSVPGTLVPGTHPDSGRGL